MKKIISLFTVTLLLFSFAFGTKVSDLHASAKVVMTEDKVFDKVKASGKIIIGTSAPFAPYEFYDKDNNIQGLDIELGKKIAAELGVTAEFQNMNFDTLLGALQSGKVDIVLSDVTPTDERKQSIAFSDIYYTSKVGILIKKANISKYTKNTSFEKTILGAQSGTIQEIIAKDDLKAKNVISLPDVASLAINLDQDKIDGLVVEDTVGKQLMKKYSDFVFAPEMLSAGDAAVATQKNSLQILESCNKVIASLKASGEINTLYDKASKLSQGIMEDSSTQSTVDKIKANLPLFFNGALYTIGIAALAILIGILFGMLFVFGRELKYIGFIFKAIVSFLRGTPLLVQLFIFAYVIFGLWIPLDKVIGNQGYLVAASLAALGLNSGAYISEIMRAGINGVDKGQTEAARSLGLSKFETMRAIILPQAIKNILPALGNEFVVIIKESAIVSTIGVIDLMKASQIMTSATYEPFLPLIMVALMYYVLTFGMSQLVAILERRLAVSDNN